MLFKIYLYNLQFIVVFPSLQNHCFSNLKGLQIISFFFTAQIALLQARYMRPVAEVFLQKFVSNEQKSQKKQTFKNVRKRRSRDDLIFFI